MYKKTILVAIVFIFSISLLAQEGQGRGRGFGGQRKSVAERVADMHSKFDSTFKFNAEKQAKIDTVFAMHFRAQDKMREEMMAQFQGGGQPDPDARQKVQDKMQEMAIERDEKLQAIMTEEEYGKWKKELEPSLRPARRMGSGNGPAAAGQ